MKLLLGILAITAPSFCLASQVLVKSGEHETFSRLVIYHEGLPTPTISRSGKQELKVNFVKEIDLLANDIFFYIPKTRVSAISGVRNSIHLALACECEVIQFEHSNEVLVIDVLNELENDFEAKTPLEVEQATIPSPLPLSERNLNLLFFQRLAEGSRLAAVENLSAHLNSMETPEERTHQVVEVPKPNASNLSDTLDFTQLWEAINIGTLEKIASKTLLIGGHKASPSANSKAWTAYAFQPGKSSLPLYCDPSISGIAAAFERNSMQPSDVEGIRQVLPSTSLPSSSAELSELISTYLAVGMYDEASVLLGESSEESPALSMLSLFLSALKAEDVTQLPNLPALDNCPIMIRVIAFSLFPSQSVGDISEIELVESFVSLSPNLRERLLFPLIENLGRIGRDRVARYLSNTIAEDLDSQFPDPKSPVSLLNENFGDVRFVPFEMEVEANSASGNEIITSYQAKASPKTKEKDISSVLSTSTGSEPSILSLLEARELANTLSGEDVGDSLRIVLLQELLLDGRLTDALDVLHEAKASSYVKDQAKERMTSVFFEHLGMEASDGQVLSIVDDARYPSIYFSAAIDEQELMSERIRKAQTSVVGGSGAVLDRRTPEKEDSKALLIPSNLVDVGEHQNNEDAQDELSEPEVLVQTVEESSIRNSASATGDDSSNDDFIVPLISHDRFSAFQSVVDETTALIERTREVLEEK